MRKFWIIAVNGVAHVFGERFTSYSEALEEAERRASRSPKNTFLVLGLRAYSISENGEVVTVDYGGEGGTSDYEDLTNKPAIDGFILTKDSTSETLGLVKLSDLEGKQDLLISGVNIKTINGESLLGSGNIAITTYQPFKQTWPTNSTFTAFMEAVRDDETATAGMAYLGELTCSGLPSGLANVEAVVEIMTGDTPSTKVIHTTITSGNLAPYRWEYTYWNGGSSVSGWITFGGGSSLPDQTGNNGKFLTTDGSNPSWADIEPEKIDYTISTVASVENVKQALDNLFNKVYYVAPTVTLSGGGTYEDGSTRSTTTLTWVLNKDMESASINQGIGNVDKTSGSHSYTYQTPISSNITFTITVSDSQATKTANTSLTFRNKKFWGISSLDTLTDAQIRALSGNEWCTSKTLAKTTFDCTPTVEHPDGFYIYYCLPSSFVSTDPTFKLNGLPNTAYLKEVRPGYVNASGKTVSYTIYRFMLNNKLTSTYELEVA